MSARSEHSRESKSNAVAVPFRSHEIELLKEIIETYQANKLDLSLGRPRFKKPRTNSGILLSEEIRQRALEKAKADPDATGGSLSGLVELLLWRYIGSPCDVVEGEKPETRDMSGE